MRSTYRRVVASLAVAAVLGAGCSDGGGGEETAAAPSPVGLANPGVLASRSSASILRANVTGLLQQHVFLTGLTTATMLGGQDPAPASAVLDGNSVALANVVGAVYGPEGSQRFLELWRRQTTLLLDFARNTASGDTGALDQTKAGLAAYGEELAEFLNTANPQLAKEALADDQKTLLSGLQSAITAQTEKDPAAVTKLKDAAEKSPRTAAVLVAGIAKQFPASFPGRVDGSAATLRSVLTSRLQEHVYLVWLTTGDVLANADTKESAAALAANSVGLANVIGSAYGDDAARRFLELWRTHIGFLVDYARGQRARDQAQVTKAVADLATFGPGFAAFLGAANPNLDEAALTGDLSVHTSSLLAAIDAQSTNAPARFTLVQAAAHHMAAMAARLSADIAEQFPGRFS